MQAQIEGVASLFMDVDELKRKATRMHDAVGRRE